MLQILHCNFFISTIFPFFHCLVSLWLPFCIHCPISSLNGLLLFNMAATADFTIHYSAARSVIFVSSLYFFSFNGHHYILPLGFFSLLVSHFRVIVSFKWKTTGNTGKFCSHNSSGITGDGGVEEAKSLVYNHMGRHSSTKSNFCVQVWKSLTSKTFEYGVFTVICLSW